MRNILAKILLFFSQFCYEELGEHSEKILSQHQYFDDEFIEEIKGKNSIEKDFTFLKELDPAVYMIFGVDDNGDQFIDINWKDEHPEIVKFIIAALINLGTGQPAALILNSLQNNTLGHGKSKDVVDEVLDHIKSISMENALNTKDSPAMSPFDVFKNVGNQ